MHETQNKCWDNLYKCFPILNRFVVVIKVCYYVGLFVYEINELQHDEQNYVYLSINHVPVKGDHTSAQSIYCSTVTVFLRKVADNKMDV